MPLLKHTLTFRVKQGEQIVSEFRMQGLSLYEEHLYEYEDIRVKVNKHLGEKVKIDDWQQIFDKTKRGELFIADATNHFNDKSFYDFSFNCHSFSFLYPEKFWFEDEESIKYLVNSKFQKISNENPIQNDVYLLFEHNKLIHSVRYFDKKFTHKKGVEIVFHEDDLETIIKEYNATSWEHIRRK